MVSHLSNFLVDPSKHLGPVDISTLPKPAAAAAAPPPASISVPQKSTSASGVAEPEEYVKPSLEEVLSLHDFEAIARRTMNRRGWNYYSSGADDEITMVSHQYLPLIFFHPLNTTECDPRVF